MADDGPALEPFAGMAIFAGAKPGATTTRPVDTDAASMENAPRASVVATTGPDGLP